MLNYDNYSSLTEILKRYGLEPSPYNDLATKGYLIINGETYPHRVALFQLGCQWQGKARAMIIMREIFEKTNYADQLLVASINIDEAQAKIFGYIDQLKESPVLHTITKKIILNPKNSEKIFTFPAAKIHHHAYPLGLAEHIIQVTESALLLANCYPFLQINKTLLIAGCLLHDVGKIECYSVNEHQINTTQTEVLVGHVSHGLLLIGNVMIESDITPDDQRILLELEHMIVSHQLQKEWDSPRSPQSNEAWILYCADQLSSKIGGGAKPLLKK